MTRLHEFTDKSLALPPARHQRPAHDADRERQRHAGRIGASGGFQSGGQGDSVMVSEALRRDFDKPLLAAAFPGWPVEAGFRLTPEVNGVAV